MSRNYEKKEDTKHNPRLNKSRGKKSFNKKDSNKANFTGLNAKDRDNDPNWYFSSPELAEQASQLSFQSVLGFGSIHGYKIPSILRFDTVLCPGNTYNVREKHGTNPKFNSASESTAYQIPTQIDPGKAGVNLMAAKLYTLLSSFTGRTASYGPQDVAMMILGIASIAEVSEHLRRVFGIALTYNFRNRALPLGIIRAMGIDADDFVHNVAIYRMRFNVAMSRINQIPLLDNIGIIRKSRDIYQNVYQDDPTSMSQLWFYQPKYAFVIDETAYSTGTVLRAVTLNSDTSGLYTNMQKFSDVLSVLEDQITAILESSTLNFIYADLLNMANKLSVPTWKFDYLAENYVVMPVFNNNALLQMHNLTIAGEPYTPSNATAISMISKTIANKSVKFTMGPHIYSDADTNEVVYNPVFTGLIGMNSMVADFPTDSPSIEDRIEALRFAAYDSGYNARSKWLSSGSGETHLRLFTALPDHYVSKAYLFNVLEPDSATTVPCCLAMDTSKVLVNDATLNTNTKYIQLTQLEHAPLVYMVTNDSTQAEHDSTFNGILGGLQYYTEVDYNYIKRLLDLMTIGLYDFRVK